MIIFIPFFCLFVITYDIWVRDYIVSFERNETVKTLIVVVIFLKLAQNLGINFFFYRKKVTKPKNMHKEIMRRFSPVLVKWCFIISTVVIPMICLLTFILMLAT